MRNYLRSSWTWPVDALWLYVVACLITPPDPLSAIVVFVVLAAVWIPVRLLLAGRLGVVRISATARRCLIIAGIGTAVVAAAVLAVFSIGL